MRSSFVWTCLVLLATAGCCGLECDEIPRDYDTPEGTLRTFMRGFLENCNEVEYRCLSKRLVAKEEISFTAYLVFRNRLENEYGFEIGVLRFLDIEGDIHDPVYDPQRPGVATVQMTVAGQGVEFDLVREANILIEAPDLWEGSYADILSAFRVVGGSDGSLFLQIADADAARELDPEELQLLKRPGAISGVRVQPEWKIDSFPNLIGAEKPAEAPETVRTDEAQ
ncbi:MAG: hypothetical protein RL885_18105 [Planctomycetota bacterium]